MAVCLWTLIVMSTMWSVSWGVLYYSVYEEDLNEKVYIGNVAVDSNLSQVVGEEAMKEMKYDFIQSGSQHVDKFRIDQTSGILTTHERLDREKLCRFNKTCDIKLKVAAISTTTVKSIEVRVKVLDVNDNAPVFKESSMTLDVSEASTVNSKFKILGATDEDMVGNNSLQGYELDPPNKHFKLINEDEKPDGSYDVFLQLIKGLDRETKDKYQLTVIAKDGGNPPKSGKLIVDITVTDVNDNKPEFSQSEYTVTVREDIKVGSNILQVKANDKDIGINGEVHYEFSDRISGNFKEFFDIDAASGNITLKKKLEYTKGASYRMIVLAADKGNPSNSEQAVVVVTVMDINNNVPQININLLTGQDTTEVSEDKPKDSVIAHVEAVDGDTGVNGDVNCSINNPIFVIKKLEKNTFIIAIDTELDREDRIEHVIRIFCMDGGSPSQNSSASFSVQVTDVNDNPPEFTNKVYTAKISENTLAPVRIAKVSAMDRDQGLNAEVRYYIDPRFRNEFSVDQTSGIIQALTPFDYELEKEVNIIVYAEDGGSPTHTASATVQLTITDENDNAPKFSQNVYQFSVREMLVTSFGNVSAKDKDASDNGRVTYSIPLQYVTLPFTVIPSGELMTQRQLDREERGRYDFTIVASDNGLNSKNSSAHIIVLVTDVNDNAPVMKFPNETNSTVFLSYLAEPQSLVTTIVAEDADSGNNGEVNYVILSGDDSNLFHLDYTSGEILLQRRIRVHEIRVYTLYISAEDNGNPQLTTQHPINIHIQFVNLTMTSPQVDGTNNNMLIAIAIACITFVFSVVIIITICIIRKMDAKKRNYLKNAEEMKIIPTMSRGSNRSSQSSKGSKDNFIPPPPFPTDIHPPFPMDRKKEVSFSADDEHDSGLTVSNPPSIASSNFVTFKSNVSVMDDPASKQIMEKPSHSRESSNLSDSKHKNVNRMASLKVQQKLLQSQEPWLQRPRSGELGNLPSSSSDRHVQDDDLSGESTTSDSGRGGSEEDLRHSISSHHPHLDFSPASSRNLSTATNSSGVLSQGSSAINRPVFTTFGHKDNRQSPVHGGLSTFPRNSPPKTGDITGAQKPDQHYLHPQISVRPGMHRLNSDHGRHPHQRFYNDIPRASGGARNYSDVPRLSSGNSRSSLNNARMLASPIDKHLQRVNGLPNLTNSNSYDDSLSESCATTNRDDDDLTTTSGSYVVNAEELCNDIDEMFFKPSDTVV